jgi:hypothetical protein
MSSLAKYKYGQKYSKTKHQGKAQTCLQAKGEGVLASLHSEFSIKPNTVGSFRRACSHIPTERAVISSVSFVFLGSDSEI